MQVEYTRRMFSSVFPKSITATEKYYFSTDRSDLVADQCTFAWKPVQLQIYSHDSQLNAVLPPRLCLPPLVPSL